MTTTNKEGYRGQEIPVSGSFSVSREVAHETPIQSGGVIRIDASQRPSVLAQVRAIGPKRKVSFASAKQLADAQASKLREVLGLGSEALFPSDAIEQLPHVRVIRTIELPVSGATQWSSAHRQWLIAINSEEPTPRQRFSLAHELKHVIDHHDREFIAWDEPKIAGPAKAEALADYFAGCLLMPEDLVRLDWTASGGDMSNMAGRFGVSVKAMTVRCSQLQLTRPIPRCAYVPMPVFRPRTATYFRVGSWAMEAPMGSRLRSNGLLGARLTTLTTMTEGAIS